MSPPTTVIYSSGGSKSAEAPGQTEKRITAVQALMTECGYFMGPSKVIRLVREFESLACSSADFFTFVADKVQLSSAQRIRAISNPDVARAISYADPTGEMAVNNVLRGNHYG